MGRKPAKHPEPTPVSALHERIYAVVHQIPAGQVASYGQVALIAGAGSARLVGQALARLPNGSGVPWHRVLNSQGKLALRKDGGPSPEQRRRLGREGVRFDRNGKVDFQTVAWTGPSWRWLERNGLDIEELALRSQKQPRSGPWSRWSL